MEIEEYRVVVRAGMSQDSRIRVTEEIEASSESEAEEKAKRRCRGKGFIVFGIETCEQIS